MFLLGWFGRICCGLGGWRLSDPDLWLKKQPQPEGGGGCDNTVRDLCLAPRCHSGIAKLPRQLLEKNVGDFIIQNIFMEIKMLIIGYI